MGFECEGQVKAFQISRLIFATHFFYLYFFLRKLVTLRYKYIFSRILRNIIPLLFRSIVIEFIFSRFYSEGIYSVWEAYFYRSTKRFRFSHSAVINPAVTVKPYGFRCGLVLKYKRRGHMLSPFKGSELTSI